MQGSGRTSARDNNHNQLITSISSRLERISPAAVDCCIFTVPDKLRRTHKEAFLPRQVSIGPFHHGKHRKAMEEHKWRYLQNFLKRTEKKLEECVEAIKEWEEQTRQCYVEHIDLSHNDFITIVLVDGAFIIELFLLNRSPKDRAENDIIFNEQKQWMITDVRRDLSLMENQLPLFVIKKLFEFAFETHLGELPSLLELAYAFFGFRANPKAKPEMIFQSNVKHLLDALRFWYLPSLEKAPSDDWKKIEAMPRASQLQAAGVKFRMSNSNCLFDIKFSKGVLEIPCFKLIPSTESFLRNITAFERSYHRDDSYFIDYVAFLGNLIDTRDDAKLLIRKKIIDIENWLGNDEALTNLFNSFGRESGFGTRNISFLRIRQDLKAYYRTFWHKLKVTVKRDSTSKKKPPG
ncbi:hypothetical protein BT93_F2122 [Corymbia citriodora subsp. variegata]|nr:hypothetical protein BT93_F2122 [Corymbia citriodora subsp. variegata]